MIRHKIGDTVLCIDTNLNSAAKEGSRGPKEQGLRTNKEYTVYDLQYCSRCGEQHISVGFAIASYVKTSTCCCGNTTSVVGGDVCFHLAKRFVKKQELTQEEETSIEEELKHILEETFSNGK